MYKESLQNYLSKIEQEIAQYIDKVKELEKELPGLKKAISLTNDGNLNNSFIANNQVNTLPRLIGTQSKARMIYETIFKENRPISSIELTKLTSTGSGFMGFLRMMCSSSSDKNS